MQHGQRTPCTNLSSLGSLSSLSSLNMMTALWVWVFLLIGGHKVWAQLSPAPDTCPITQITDTIAGDAQYPALDADGTRVVFQSTADLTGENPDGNTEIFLFDMSSAAFTQITHTTKSTTQALGIDPNQTNRTPRISATGTRIAFVSDADLNGENSDRSAEVFVYDTDSAVFIQLTNTTSILSNLGRPALNSDGTRIVFWSNEDLTGENIDGRGEVFLFETSTNALSQVTNSTDFSGGPVINAAGTRIAYEASGTSAIHLLDTTTNTVIQVPGPPQFPILNPSISADGTRIVFEVGYSTPRRIKFFQIFLFDTTTSTLTSGDA